MMRRHDRRAKSPQQKLPYADIPKQVLPWLWSAPEPQAICPGCGRHLKRGWGAGQCFWTIATGHDGVAIFCRTDYDLTRGQTIVSDVYGQTLIAELSRLVETGDGGAP